MSNNKYVVNLTRESINKPHDAAQILWHAFSDDPCFRYFFPKKFDQNRMLIFRNLVDNLGVDSGIVKTCVMDNFDESGTTVACSASLWFKSTNVPGFLSYLFSGMWKFSLSPKTAYRLLQWVLKIEPFHTKIMGNRPHYYLLYFGTLPTSEGRGFGSTLMKDQLKVIDEENLEAYLECSNEKSVPFYEKNGFIAEHTFVEEGFPKVIVMRRPKQREDVPVSDEKPT